MMVFCTAAYIFTSSFRTNYFVQVDVEEESPMNIDRSADAKGLKAD